MAKEATSVSPKFQLRAVELHELVVHKVAPGFSVNSFNFDINIETNVDNNQKIVIVSTKVKIIADDKKTELGRVICACVFNVANFEEVVQVKGENILEVIDSFAETINSVSISTTRGFMASELKGTILHYAFLPIIDVKSLSKEAIH
jgi:hypothetical protein